MPRRSLYSQYSENVVNIIFLFFVPLSEAFRVKQSLSAFVLGIYGAVKSSSERTYFVGRKPSVNIFIILKVCYFNN